MEFRALGRTGIHVSPLCLGTMMFGAWGNTDSDECVRIIHRALDAGINFVDTADVYAFGETEEILGRALAGRRDDVVVATKFYNAMDNDPNHRGASRRWIVKACEDSLRRLGTDYIDLYQVHHPDPETDIDETLGALSDLVRAGKVRAIGTSVFPAEQIVQAQWTAERRGHVRFMTEQPSYSIFARHAEAAVLPVAEQYGLGVLVWSPLNGGWLTGKYRREVDAPTDSRAATNGDHFDYRFEEARQRKLDLVEPLEQLAKAAGLTLIELALAFVQSHRAVTSAIIGPRTMAQLDSQLPAAGRVLSDDVLDAIDALVLPGTDINPADTGYVPPSVSNARARRR
jgi:aryl-alcohol dehydrogenase-like predicted oxidoreductase